MTELAQQQITDSEQIERVRRAVLKRGGTVTVGDIMSETGLGADEAKDALRNLIQTHEGTMRVSETGEVMYAFAPGCILRDQRSWWERNKKAILKGIKVLFKIIIMLVLVIYFIIYLVILIALLTNNRNNRSSGNGIGWAIYFFWGRGGDTSDYASRSTKQPLYTRVYNFVFGPEEEEPDPLEARAKCAQLIRAKRGVITADDWAMVSGLPRAKCDSELARYTAEFDGTAEITENGTLVYVFEDMMKSTNKRDNTTMPAPAWKNLESKRLLSGNKDGNGAVIGLNLFNIIMSFLCLYGGQAYLESLRYESAYGYINDATMSTANNFFLWLGLIPFIFSALIFLVPLIRLPFNIRENNQRRERNIRRAALAAVLSDTATGGGVLTVSGASSVMTNVLRNSEFDMPTAQETMGALNEISEDFGGESVSKGADNAYRFDMLEIRTKDAEAERKKRHLERQDLGRVVYSTDSREADKYEANDHAAELDDFDRALQAGSYNNPYGARSGVRSQSRAGYR